MKTSHFSMLAAGALAALVACSHSEKPATTGYEPAMSPAARDAPSAPGELGAENSERLSDPQIVTVVRGANVAEVDQARIAVGKVKNDEVKNFAEMMIAQHGQAVKDIDALTSRLGYQATESQLSTELGVSTTQVANKLSTTNDDTFDRVYIMNQIDEHRKVLDTIDTRLVPAARNNDVKDLLQKQRPVVAEHLQIAQRILDSLH